MTENLQIHSTAKKMPYLHLIVSCFNRELWLHRDQCSAGTYRKSLNNFKTNEKLDIIGLN
jgi:hypothetical protein